MSVEELKVKSQVTGDYHRFLEFTLGSEDYAIPLLSVREVISVPETTPIPKAPTHFLGIMNLRGQVISVVDLRTKLKIKSKDSFLKHESQSALITKKFFTLRLVLFFDATSKAFIEKSDPYILKFGFLRAIEIPIHPEPVPASKTFKLPFKLLFTYTTK